MKKLSHAQCQVTAAVHAYAAGGRALTALLRRHRQQLAPGLFLACADAARSAAAGDGAGTADALALPATSPSSPPALSSAAGVRRVREALDRGEPVRQPTYDWLGQVNASSQLRVEVECGSRTHHPSYVCI